jgi:hypothetical protein
LASFGGSCPIDLFKKDEEHSKIQTKNDKGINPKTHHQLKGT